MCRSVTVPVQLLAYRFGSDAGFEGQLVGEALAPGEALAAVLVGHDWAGAINDAVERIGGTAIVNGFAENASFDQLVSALAAPPQSS